MLVEWEVSRMQQIWGFTVTALVQILAWGRRFVGRVRCAFHARAVGSLEANDTRWCEGSNKQVRFTPSTFPKLVYISYIYICKWMLYRKLHTETNMKENRHMIITYTVSGLPWFQTKLLTQTLRTCDAAETNTWGDSWWHRVWCFHYISFIFMGCNNWFFGTYLVDFIQTSPVPRCCLPHMTEIARMRQSTSRW